VFKEADESTSSEEKDDDLESSINSQVSTPRGEEEVSIDLDA
jgi:hypothetical protein